MPEFAIEVAKRLWHLGLRRVWYVLVAVVFLAVVVGVIGGVLYLFVHGNGGSSNPKLDACVTRVDQLNANDPEGRQAPEQVCIDEFTN